jgi:large subunit ribosomal protein L7A
MNSKISGKKVIGAKQTLKSVKLGSAKVVYIAEDAEQKVTKPIVESCSQNGVEVIIVPTMHELGKMCDIDVGAATACVLKD